MSVVLIKNDDDDDDDDDRYHYGVKKNFNSLQHLVKTTPGKS